MVGGNSLILSIKNLENLANELCGSIPTEDRELILKKTFSTFNLNTSEPITEATFIEVLYM